MNYQIHDFSPLMKLIKIDILSADGNGHSKEVFLYQLHFKDGTAQCGTQSRNLSVYAFFWIFAL
ncbi:hypothetical protein QQP08_011950 [Theobroma cacao]|nr:hypothetical protein QQP08_011950 [Theobroma cacao]